MSSASAELAAAPAPAPAPAKTLEEYMDEIKKNKELIDGQQQIITGQIAQGEKVLNTLKSSVSMTMPQGQGQGPAPAPEQKVITPIPTINAIEEEEKKKRKKGNWISNKGDWEKKKREHDEKVKKSKSDIEAYETFVADKSEDELKALEMEFKSYTPSYNKPPGYSEYKVLRKARDVSIKFIENDVIPREGIDKKFAEQREARKKVLLNFEKSLNLLNTKNKEINNKIKEIVKKETTYVTMPDKEKDSGYIQLKSEKEDLSRQKKEIEKNIGDLIKNKDNELAPIDKAITDLKKEAKKKEIGGKTRKKRTKNMKIRQSRKN